MSTSASTPPSNPHRPSTYEQEVAEAERELGLTSSRSRAESSRQVHVAVPRDPSPCHSSERTLDVSEQKIQEKGQHVSSSWWSRLKGKGKASTLEDVTEGYTLSREEDKIMVDFSHNSPHDPQSYSLARKWGITFVAVFFTYVTSADVGCYSSGFTSMMRDLNATQLQAAAGLGLYAWGFAMFPLALAPLSEEFGRRPLYIISAILFWLCHFGEALAPNMVCMLIFRFLSGGAGSVGATVVGGSLADVWKTSERGTKMALFSLCASMGTVSAPVAFSWVELNPRLEWRWIQWIQIIIVGAYLPLVPILMPETRAALKLEKKAAQLREMFGDEEEKGRYTARSEEGKLPLIQLIKVSLYRPLFMVSTEPICLFFSIWVALAWGILYGLLESVGYTFKLLYNFNEGQVGLMYIALVIGVFLAFFGSLYQERLYQKHFPRIGPEARLFSAMIGGPLFAIGGLIYGWTAYSHITWAAPAIGIGILIMGIFTIYLTVFNYLADSYGIYASSSLAGQSFLRNMLAGAFPFFVRQTYENLGIHWASTLFAILAAVLAVVPFIAFFYGPQIRARSNFSKKLQEDEEKARIAKEERLKNSQEA